MNLEVVKKALKEEKKCLGLICLWFKLNKDLLIRLEYVDENDWDLPENLKILNFHFVAKFYDCEYSFSINSKDIKRDTPDTGYIDGDSKLFDSFESLITEEDNWEIIKLMCKRMEELEILECV